MEHVKDDSKAMQEIFRVMKPGGWGIIQIPLFHPLPETTYEDSKVTSPADREKAFGQSDHVRLYGKDYIDRLKSAGFEAKEIWLGKEMDEGLMAKYAFPADEPIFFVQKPTI